MAKITLEDLIDIAFAVEEGDPFDWGSFKQGKTEAMKMIGTSILDQFDKDTYTENERLVMLATLTKLVTENMILHSKLLTQSQKESKI
jgi:hypothetical protein